MTIPEAVQLVLQAAAISGQGVSDHPRRFLLEMGEPVRIVDLARQMIRLSGKVPDVDIPIIFTGPKSGEKLTEALVDDGEFAREVLAGILEVGMSCPHFLTDNDVAALTHLSEQGSPQDLLDALAVHLRRARQSDLPIQERQAI